MVCRGKRTKCTLISSIITSQELLEKVDCVDVNTTQCGAIFTQLTYLFPGFQPPPPFKPKNPQIRLWKDRPFLRNIVLKDFYKSKQELE